MVHHVLVIFFKILLYLCFFSFISCGHRSAVNSNHSRPMTYFDDLKSIEILNSSFHRGWDIETTRSLYSNLSKPYLSSLIDSSLDSNDINLLKCSNFNSLAMNQKKIFYIIFLAAIAERESDFDSENETYDYIHNNINIGLLQIDRLSAVRHAPEIASKDISNENLKDPNTNLAIGAFILKNQINGKWNSESLHRLFPLKSYYWEVLNQKKRNKVIASFANNQHNLPFCTH